MGNELCILGTYRHPDLFDSSRILVSNSVVHRLFDQEEFRDNIKFIDTLYEINGRRNKKGLIDLRPFYDYVSPDFISDYAIVPWWEEATQDSVDIYIMPYVRWLFTVLDDLASIGISFDANSFKEYIVKLLAGMIAGNKTLSEFPSNLSDYLSENIIGVSVSPPIPYWKSAVNIGYISYLKDKLTCDCFHNELDLFLQKSSEISWCIAYELENKNLALLSYIGENRWKVRELKLKQGRTKKKSRIIDSDDLLHLLDELVENDRYISVVGYFSDILRVMKYKNNVRIFHIGDDRGATKEIAIILSNDEGASLQLIRGKEESFDPFEKKYQRKFSLLEVFLLKDEVGVQQEVGLATELIFEKINLAISDIV